MKTFNILRLTGGLLGLLMLAGSISKWLEHDRLIPSVIACTAIGAVVLAIALFAPDDDLDQWFGGL